MSKANDNEVIRGDSLKQRHKHEVGLREFKAENVESGLNVKSPNSRQSFDVEIFVATDLYLWLSQHQYKCMVGKGKNCSVCVFNYSALEKIWFNFSADVQPIIDINFYWLFLYLFRFWWYFYVFCIRSASWILTNCLELSVWSHIERGLAIEIVVYDADLAHANFNHILSIWASSVAFINKICGHWHSSDWVSVCLYRFFLFFFFFSHLIHDISKSYGLFKKLHSSIFNVIHLFRTHTVQWKKNRYHL